MAKRKMLTNKAKREIFTNVIANAVASRRALLQRLLNPGKDMNYECGWPDTIGITDYKTMFDREGLGNRVVSLIPNESWAMLPKIYETKEAEKTDFEKRLEELDRQRHVLSYLQKVDVLSGIGRFGILLVGLNDKKELNIPVEGIDPVTGEVGSKKQEREVLYLRAFDESVVRIQSKEKDSASPRYGHPVMYSVDFETIIGTTVGAAKKEVHWTRILHVADNKTTSEVYGTPRMKMIWNRLLDIRKILGGGAEMFWKGAFPGYGLEIDPEVEELTTTEKKDLRGEFEDYAAGLQRWITLQGMKIKELKPQVANPQSHIDMQKRDIATALGCPYRVFVGSEAAHLASTEDIRTWNKRMALRRDTYITPMLIRPFLDRLIAYGVLPEVEEYFVEWPDLVAPTEKEKAEIEAKRTEAFAKYIQGGVDELIPPKEYLMMIWGMSEKQVSAILEAADSREK